MDRGSGPLERYVRRAYSYDDFRILISESMMELRTKSLRVAIWPERSELLAVNNLPGLA